LLKSLFNCPDKKKPAPPRGGKIPKIVKNGKIEERVLREGDFAKCGEQSQG